jgi:REP element-mobilizing transposase RayT
VFTERWVVTEVTSQLFQSAAVFECVVLAYCVMPDHLHALVEVQSEPSDFEALMKGFTQATDCAYRQHTRRPLWQPGYHERMLRDDEASDTIARYILENPLRAGLSRTIGEYPFAWSDVYDLETLFSRETCGSSRRHEIARSLNS